MNLPTLVFISPHSATSPGLPNRPASLLSAFIDAQAFGDVMVVNRVRPIAFLERLHGGRPIWGGGLPGSSQRLSSGAILVEHPWPFGALERRFLGGMLAALAGRSTAAVVAWVADPKSITAVVGAGDDQRSWRIVADTYDAWDRSPLVRGERRLQAVSAGYRAAASDADLIFANTTAMRDRLAGLGARDARVLSNACPPLEPGPVGGSGRPEGLVYVGRIHERFDAKVAGDIAAALPETTLTIAGPVEREPVGWSSLVARPNVVLLGPMEPTAARRLIGAAAALIIPHIVDDYTRSQDVMKAWDAIASGTPVISTPIPPTDGWPMGLAEVCPNSDSFVIAARRAVAGQLEAGRAGRLAFAAANQWSARAAVAITAIGMMIDVQERTVR